MHRIVCSIIVAVFFSATATSAIAQQQEPGPRRDRPSKEQREAVMKKMDAVRIARLTETLQLDEKTAAAFIPVITALEHKRRDLVKENHEIMQEMRSLLHASPPDEGKLKAHISRIERNREEIAAHRSQEFEAARHYLTVTQTARYIIFNQEFQQEMRRMLNRTRGGHGPGQGPGRMSSPPENR